MCGIYGTTIKYNNNQFKAKLERVSFRGPDKLDWKSTNTNGKTITLGHNRLSIIDLDARSNQPFNYIDHVHIAFNGEIYNFRDIKDTLEKKGYKFSTTSDTEVVCAAYMEYGNDCVNHLNGMFAFVIHDLKNNKFFGARDRMGQKPFYYQHNGLDFEFSSQISSIQLFNEKLSISKKAILEYLKWGAIPEPLSIFNEVHKLPPGYSFTFDIDNGKFIKQKYWDIDHTKKPSYSGSYSDAIHDLEFLMKDAVKSRMYADVPIGVFLSGGIDSSLISALATKTVGSKVKTFAVKFNEKRFDESVYAKQVADHLKTDHHVIECNYDEGLDLIQNFSHYYDEPFADPSAIPSMLLAKYTRKHVTVALSGDGGDESFLGYHRYKWMKKVQYLYMVPKAMRNTVAAIIGLAPNYRMKTIAKGLSHESIEDLYLGTLTNIDLSWIDHSWGHKDVLENEYLYHNNKNLFERITDFDLKGYLNWHINTKVDRATMAYSLEARAPLMDYRVIEFARNLPTNFKYHKNNQKRILKDLLYKHVPSEIFQRPKAGFTMPFEEWFRKDLKTLVLDELSRENLEKIPGINVDKVLLMINQHMEESWNRYPIIWKLLVLKQWLDTNGKGLIIR